MKFNKWTLGLAAVGAVSMASAVRADEAKLVPVQTALSSTVISGYVDVGAQYNLGDYGPGAGVPAGTSGNIPGGFVNKIDNFTLNNVDIALDKAQDESPWASGYHVDLNFGTDALGVGLNNATTEGTGTIAIRQGYVVIRTPVGNGIDWKVGVQDDIIGYEGNTDGANPNYTRSIGYSVEPATLLGLIGSYKIVDGVTVQGGIANALSGVPSAGPGYFSSSDKTFAAALALTAPDSFGFAKGATLTLGTLLNIDKGGQDNFYAGVTVPTPLSILKVGAAFDLVSLNNAGPGIGGGGGGKNDSGWVLGLYGALQPTDKLAFNLRGEYYDMEGTDTFGGTPNFYSFTNGKGEEITATVQYNLWANVISRAEFRWDHVDSGTAFANSGKNENAFLLAANLIYTF